MDEPQYQFSKDGYAWVDPLGDQPIEIPLSTSLEHAKAIMQKNVDAAIANHLKLHHQAIQPSRFFIRFGTSPWFECRESDLVVARSLQYDCTIAVVD